MALVTSIQATGNLYLRLLSHGLVVVEESFPAGPTRHLQGIRTGITTHPEGVMTNGSLIGQSHNLITRVSIYRI